LNTDPLLTFSDSVSEALHWATKVELEFSLHTLKT